MTVNLDRKLTSGERTLAYSVFGDALQLDSITLCARWWVLPHYAISPNGYIYFHTSNMRSDFADAPLAIRAWFIHELTHVWQFQKGRAVFWRALIDRRYQYALQLGRDFWQYGIEQQAQMVQDYYLQREQGLDCRALEACVPFLATIKETIKKPLI